MGILKMGLEKAQQHKMSDYQLNQGLGDMTTFREFRGQYTY